MNGHNVRLLAAVRRHTRAACARRTSSGKNDTVIRRPAVDLLQ
jgi:hypothetical protein